MLAVVRFSVFCRSFWKVPRSVSHRKKSLKKMDDLGQ